MTTWDEGKRARNFAKHKVDLADAEAFAWSTALDEEDLTEDYGEQRFRAIGQIDGDLYVCVYADNEDGTPHIISLRKATKKEKRYYAQNV